MEFNFIGEENLIIELVLRFFFNFLMIFIIVQQIYYRIEKNKDYRLTLVVLNIVVFLVFYLLSKVEIGFDLAFGIFAIFSILRYRTSQVPVKEMTYMFIAIALGILNTINANVMGYLVILFANVAIVLSTFILEKTWKKTEFKKTVVYEKIENIKPENYETLIKDLELRTGLKILRAEVSDINFMQDSAQINIFFHQEPKNNEI